MQLQKEAQGAKIPISIEDGGVWIFIEQREGKILRVGLELLKIGNRLASILNTQVVALILGNKVEGLGESLIEYGADIVFQIEDPLLIPFQSEAYATVLTDLAALFKPDILLLGATTFGRDLAPRLGVILGTGVTADCVGLDIDIHRHLVAIVPALGGNIFAKVVWPSQRPQIAIIRPGVITLPERDPKKQGTIHTFRPEIDPASLKVHILETSSSLPEERPLEEADTILAVGYGIRTDKTFNHVRKLTQLLRGQIGGTRPAVDAHWISESQMIGQSGKTIRPKLYIAIGVSGALQHVVGIQEAEIIVAINRDQNAPIFEIADYGIVGDAQQIIPALIKALEEEREF